MTARNRRPTVPGEVVRFIAAVLVVNAVVGAIGFVVLSQDAINEAQRSAQEIATVQGMGIVEPALTDGLLSGDASAIAEVNRVVRTRVLDAHTVRVKIWDGNGRILYSDETRLIGQVFPLGPNELAGLRSGQSDSYVSDLTKPENQYERRFGQLLEVYLPIQTPSGQKVLFETYLQFGSVEAQQQRIMLQFGPVLIGGMILLLLVEVPLAWSMARRLRAAAIEREALLVRAVDASEGERRRIAGDLHDGVVQRLSGTWLSLSAAALKLPKEDGGDGESQIGRAVRQGSAEVREAVRELRSLIVRIAPAGLSADSLPDALADLTVPLKSAGVETELRLSEVELRSEEAQLVFRVAQEAVRNIARHSRARHATLELAITKDGRKLTVADDGDGFDVNTLAARRREGHIGLGLLKSLAEDGGARLRIVSASGEGTRLELSLP
jgi:signal transduction histidine kinase